MPTLPDRFWWLKVIAGVLLSGGSLANVVGSVLQIITDHPLQCWLEFSSGLDFYVGAWPLPSPKGLSIPCELSASSSCPTR